jgi:hypothetical protein
MKTLFALRSFWNLFQLVQVSAATECLFVMDRVVQREEVNQSEPNPEESAANAIFHASENSTAVISDTMSIRTGCNADLIDYVAPCECFRCDSIVIERSPEFFKGLEHLERILGTELCTQISRSFVYRGSAYFVSAYPPTIRYST